MTAKTIHKFSLRDVEDQLIELPIGAKILDAQFQRGVLCLWALVDPTAPKEGRWFRVSGTGHTVLDEERLTHIATAQLDTLVFHVFEVNRK